MSDASTKGGKAAAEWASVFALSPLVITARMTQFWASAATPGRRDHHEAERMVTEKIMAMSESVVAMNIAVVQAAVAASTAVLTGQVRDVDDVDAIMTAGLKPYTSRLKANQRRLQRRG